MSGSGQQSKGGSHRYDAKALLKAWNREQLLVVKGLQGLAIEVMRLAIPCKETFNVLGASSIMRSCSQKGKTE
jgi:hypothetical protein